MAPCSPGGFCPAFWQPGRCHKEAIRPIIRSPRRRGRAANFESERLGGPEVDHQLEFGRLHHWKIASLLTLENPTNINADLVICIGKTVSVAHILSFSPS